VRPVTDLFVFIMRFYLKAPLLTLLPDPRDAGREAS
jgi:hypothetical protein